MGNKAMKFAEEQYEDWLAFCSTHSGGRGFLSGACGVVGVWFTGTLLIVATSGILFKVVPILGILIMPLLLAWKIYVCYMFGYNAAKEIAVRKSLGYPEAWGIAAFFFNFLMVGGAAAALPRKAKAAETISDNARQGAPQAPLIVSAALPKAGGGEARVGWESRKISNQDLVQFALYFAYAHVALAVAGVIVACFFGGRMLIITNLFMHVFPMSGFIIAMRRRMLWGAIALAVFGFGTFCVKISEGTHIYFILYYLAAALVYAAGAFALKKSGNYRAPIFKGLPWKRIGIAAILYPTVGVCIDIAFALLGLLHNGTPSLPGAIVFTILNCITTVGIFLWLIRKAAWPLETILGAQMVGVCALLVMSPIYSVLWGFGTALAIANYGHLAWFISTRRSPTTAELLAEAS